jgi:hypothetical protein
MRSAIPLIFFALAIWFLLGGRTASLSLPPAVEIDAKDLETGPRRNILADPPEVMIGGFAQRCETCHMLFESRAEAASSLKQHTEIRLDHGLNSRCYNCHSIEDRNKLVLHDGSLLGYEQVVDLCAKCHGPTFRDRERGTHGKTLGSWDAASGEMRRLKCTECHDPHSPAIPGMKPLPGPNTMRMGAGRAHAGSDEEENRNPLQRQRKTGVNFGEEQ